MKKILDRRSGFVVPPDVARDAIGEKIVFKQNEIGGPDVSGPLLDQLALRIVNEVEETLGEDMNRITALLPVG